MNLNSSIVIHPHVEIQDAIGGRKISDDVGKLAGLIGLIDHVVAGADPSEAFALLRMIRQAMVKNAGEFKAAA